MCNRLSRLARFQLFAVVLSAACPAVAQTGEGGGVIIRVEDGAEKHCISRATEDVTVNLRRILTIKHKGWFTEGKQISAVLAVKVNGKHSGQTNSFTLPQGFLATIESYPGGL